MLWRTLYTTHLHIDRAIRAIHRKLKRIAEHIHREIAEINHLVGRYLERRYVVEILQSSNPCRYLELRYLSLEDLEEIAIELSKKGFAIAEIEMDCTDYPTAQITLVRNNIAIHLRWKHKVVEKSWIQCEELA